MKLSILAAACILGSEPQTQGPFVELFGGAAFDRGVHVSATSDGGYVAIGVTKSFGQGGDDVYLVRTDSAGKLSWSKSFGGPRKDNGWSVHETRDGFILAGYTRSYGAGGFDFYLVKTDRGGALQWEKTYGGPEDDLCWALALTPDGGYLLAGETKSSGAGEEDFFLVKTDHAGTEQWSRTYGGAQGDRCFAVVPEKGAAGGYVLAGQTYSRGAGDRDAFVIKIDASGDPLWTRTFGGSESDVAHSIAGTSDGNYIVTGYTTSFAPAGDDPYLIKLDRQGQTLWTRVIPIDGVNHTITGEQARDGGFYLAGFTDHASGERSALLVKTNPEGQLVWSRDVHRAAGEESFGYTVRATADGGCVFTGHTTVGSAGNRDLLLVKVAAP